jgi:hypothetical protein
MKGVRRPGFAEARRGVPSPAGLGFLVGAALVVVLAADARAQDVTLPVLVSYAVSPAIIDVTGGPANATVTARFTDDLSGFESASVLYAAPGFTALSLVEIATSDRISGDALDGVYETTFEVPEFEKAGVWTVFSFTVRDVAENSGDIPPASLPPTTAYEVQSIEDTGPPAIASFGATPAAVDVTLGPGAVTVTTQLTDDVSGVDDATVTFESPGGSETATLVMDAADRISGDALDGVYRGVLEIPQLAENGIWTVQNVRVVDTFGYSSDVSAAGLPGTAPTVSVTSTPDTGQPQIVSISLSPPGVDLAIVPRQVVVTLHITDDVTGLGSAGVLFESPVEGIAETLPIDASHRISGGPLDGVYQNTVTFPRDSPLGVWAISLFANDPAGNSVVLTGSSVPGPNTLTVFTSISIPALGPAASALLLALLGLTGVALLPGRPR